MEYRITDLGKTCVYNEIQEAAKKLVPHQDRCEEVPEDKCASTLPGIVPDWRRGVNQVYRKESSIRTIEGG